MAGLKQRFAPYQRAGLASNQSRAVNDRLWLQADILSPEIDFCLYEALAVKVVLVCVA